MPTSIVKTETELYAVGDSHSITLQITIGDGQVGGSHVVLDGADVPTNPLGHYVIRGDNLRYKLLICTTQVKDVQANTNRTSVAYSLSGGTEDQEFAYAVAVADNGTATYSITIAFI